MVGIVLLSLLVVSLIALVVPLAFASVLPTDQPAAEFSFDQEGTSVQVTHVGGDTLDPEEISIIVRGHSIDVNQFPSDQPITPGSTVDVDLSQVSGYVMLQLVWQRNQASAVLDSKLLWIPSNAEALGGGPSFSSLTLSDSSQERGPERVEFTVSYEIDDPEGDFDRVEVDFINHDTPSVSETLMSSNQIDDITHRVTGGQIDFGDEYDIIIRLFDDEGEVVDERVEYTGIIANGEDP